MLKLPLDFILYDTEFTAWNGSRERNWSGPNEHREIVQVGAIQVNSEALSETKSILLYIRPKINPTLSEYLINLTGIDQHTIDMEGLDFTIAIQKFKVWCGDLPMYSFGNDISVVLENCRMHSCLNPFKENQSDDARKFFDENGYSTKGYNSGTIVRSFGEELSRQGHDALNDARTILDGLILLKKSGVEL